MKDLDAIIEELKNEALDVTEEGWLSDLSSERLEWVEGAKAIVIGDWIGSIDVGHLSGIVESLISDATKDLATRLEQAEQEAKAAKGVITQHIAERSLETHRNVGIAVDEAVKAVVQLLIEDPSRRAREAEAAVARVREQRDKWDREGSAYWISAEAAVIALDYALRALDGEPNE